jgi:catechol 2,3-dioxygenase-like lactoylglutathione lyase family enzyme
MTPKFDAIGLVVTDMTGTLAFYRALGLEFAEGAETAPHAEATLPGGVRLMLDPVAQVRTLDPTWQPPSGGPRMGLAFRCDSPADVDKLYGSMEKYGHKAPWDAPWGQRYAVLHDPDGNPVDLFAPL